MIEGFGFGIDFGTTNSVASAFNGRKVTSFLDDSNLPHPSVLWYRGEGQPVVGRKAKDNIKEFGTTPGNQFFKSIKSSFGQDIEYEIFGKKYTNVEIASKIFQFLREDIQARYDSYPDMKEAVVTVPLYFNGLQRRSIRKAAELAGIFVKSFIHEPFAAVIGYLYSGLGFSEQLRNIDAKKNILVFDWGGGTLDITLVKLDSGKIFEISNRGESGKSGDYFDELLMKYVLSEFQQEYSIPPQSFHISSGTESILAHNIEFAKIDLSDRDKAGIRIADFYSFNRKSINLRSEVSREQFEFLINPHIQDAMTTLDSVLQKARLNSSQVDLVLLIGGTSKVPLLHKLMQDTFGIAKVQRVLNADSIISEGAAIISYHNWQPYLVNPICVQMSDESYYTIFDSGTILKPEVAQKEVTFFCTDNRDGEGIFILSDKLSSNSYQTKDPIIRVPVARKLLDIYKERVITDVRIDRDLILQVSAKGSIQDEAVYAEYHDLCYGLRFA